jgi:hypothetical protein
MVQRSPAALHRCCLRYTVKFLLRSRTRCFKCSDHGPPDTMMLCRMSCSCIAGLLTLAGAAASRFALASSFVRV